MLHIFSGSQRSSSNLERIVCRTQRIIRFESDLVFLHDSEKVISRNPIRLPLSHQACWTPVSTIIPRRWHVIRSYPWERFLGITYFSESKPVFAEMISRTYLLESQIIDYCIYELAVSAKHWIDRMTCHLFLFFRRRIVCYQYLGITFKFIRNIVKTFHSTFQIVSAYNNDMECHHAPSNEEMKHYHWRQGIKDGDKGAGAVVDDEVLVLFRLRWSVREQPSIYFSMLLSSMMSMRRAWKGLHKRWVGVTIKKSMQVVWVPCGCWGNYYNIAEEAFPRPPFGFKKSEHGPFVVLLPKSDLSLALPASTRHPFWCSRRPFGTGGEVWLGDAGESWLDSVRPFSGVFSRFSIF